MDISKDEAIIEAILFAVGEKVLIKDLAVTLKKTNEQTKEIVLNLAKKYEQKKRGIKIIQIEDAFQICTNPEYLQQIKSLYSVPKKQTLSQPLLETLAIVAYKQPITKAQIEDIRGVNSDYAVNSLIKFKLIEEKGRANFIGKPILLGTTDDFLKHFGFNNLNQLPKIENEEKIKQDTENEII